MYYSRRLAWTPALRHPFRSQERDVSQTNAVSGRPHYHVAPLPCTLELALRLSACSISGHLLLFLGVRTSLAFRPWTFSPHDTSQRSKVFFFYLEKLDFELCDICCTLSVVRTWIIRDLSFDTCLYYNRTTDLVVSCSECSSLYYIEYIRALDLFIYLSESIELGSFKDNSFLVDLS